MYATRCIRSVQGAGVTSRRPGSPARNGDVNAQPASRRSPIRSSPGGWRPSRTQATRSSNANASSVTLNRQWPGIRYARCTRRSLVPAATQPVPRRRCSAGRGWPALRPQTDAGRRSVRSPRLRVDAPTGSARPAIPAAGSRGRLQPDTGDIAVAPDTTTGATALAGREHRKTERDRHSHGGHTLQRRGSPPIFAGCSPPAFLRFWYRQPL